MTRPAEPRPPAARLLVESGLGGLKVAVAGDVFSLGSDEACSLVLDAEGVARRHAIIQRDGARYELFDLLSPGGTFVNGRRIEAIELKTGDAVRLGAARLVFLLDVPRPEAARPSGVAAASAAAADSPALAFLEPPPTVAPPTPAPPAAFGGAGDATPTSPAPAPLGGRAAPSFDETLVDQLRRTPFFVTSLVLHGGLLVLLALLAPRTPPPEVVGPVRATLELGPENLDLDVADDDPAPTVDVDLDRPADAPEPEPVSEPVVLDRGERDDPPGITPEDFGPFRGSSGGVDAGALEKAGAPLAGGADAGGPALRAYADELRGTGLDVVFVLDGTGSMEACLDEARRRVNEAVAVLSALVPEFRLGFVSYRDKADEYLVKTTPLTKHHYEAVDFLDGLRAAGGGDIPEAVDEGLRAALGGMKFGRLSRRIVVLVGDAPAHDPQVDAVRSMVDGVSRSRGVLHTVYCPSPGRPDPKIRAFFADLARRGGGVALDLAQGRRLVEEVLPVIFGDRFKNDMTRAIADATRGRRAERKRAFVAEADATALRRALSVADPEAPYLLNAIAESTRPEHLRAFLDVLGDREAPEGNRWAAAVFAKRVIRRAAPPPRLYELAEGLRPSLPPNVLEERLRLVRASAARVGFAVAPAVSDVPAGRGR